MNQAEADAAVTVTNLSAAYEHTEALSGIDWQVPRGHLAAIIGPNGGGKSTLLKSMVGMVVPQAGGIRLFGDTPKRARRRVAYLPQSEDVDWMFPISSLEVVMQGRTAHHRLWQRHSRSDRKHAVEQLRRVGMEAYAHRPVGDLSGGQRQRVFIARALTQNAELLLMDEPGTGLDASAQHELLDLFEQLKSTGHTVVITTHDLNCLAEHFDLVLGLDKHVVVSGPPRAVLSGDVLTRLFSKHFPVITPEGEVTLHD